MAHCNIQHPKTMQWRCWSTIVDDWITDWLDEEDYKEWYIREHGEYLRLQVETLGIKPSKNYSYEWCVFTKALHEQKCSLCCPYTCDCENCEFNVSYEFYKENGFDFLNLNI